MWDFIKWRLIAILIILGPYVYLSTGAFSGIPLDDWNIYMGLWAMIIILIAGPLPYIISGTFSAAYFGVLIVGTHYHTPFFEIPWFNLFLFTSTFNVILGGILTIPVWLMNKVILKTEQMRLDNRRHGRH